MCGFGNHGFGGRGLVFSENFGFLQFIFLKNYYGRFKKHFIFWW